ncbi:hypothetical protein SF1_18420 [Sphingobacterium faecium NBRC 15299]|uniref:hypothetical protein n=1 Tax=Sphingobacterium faecium TaxID=34087 RepID=UPI000D3B3A5B|nr:hypothetical protein [Sphingobacterium faecium]PTX09519.1 hypothetical protein C8N37_106147 [Sphingobacterium faecium]GEM63860.1 hypothetical protein SF1_18420 [Sphingobacterium faecium NBRC 15299]
MGKPLPPEKLFALRRLRKARRLFKQQPVFAFAILCEEYKDYTHEQFLDDLRIRTKTKGKKKKKSPLTRYGRFFKMNQLLELYSKTGLVDFALQAFRLRSVITKPYRVLVKIEGCHIEYGLNPFIPYKEVEKLNLQLRDCKTEKEVDYVIEQFRSANRIG